MGIPHPPNKSRHSLLIQHDAQFPLSVLDPRVFLPSPKTVAGFPGSFQLMPALGAVMVTHTSLPWIRLSTRIKQQTSQHGGEYRNRETTMGSKASINGAIITHVKSSMRTQPCHNKPLDNADPGNQNVSRESELPCALAKFSTLRQLHHPNRILLTDPCSCGQAHKNGCFHSISSSYSGAFHFRPPRVTYVFR